MTDFVITEADVGRKVKLANGGESTIDAVEIVPYYNKLQAKLLGGLVMNTHESMKEDIISDAQEELEKHGFYFELDGSYIDEEDKLILGDGQNPVGFVEEVK